MLNVGSITTLEANEEIADSLDSTPWTSQDKRIWFAAFFLTWSQNTKKKSQSGHRGRAEWLIEEGEVKD
jgi:hypothetical protein